MIIKIRNTDKIEKESVRIEIGKNEFLITEHPDGLYITEITDDSISIRPHTANVIVLQIKKKSEIL